MARNRADSVLGFVIRVFSRLRSNFNLLLKKVLRDSNISDVSVLVPLIAIIQSSAYLT